MSGEQFLLVDDEPDLRALYAEMLDESYDPVTAASGEEAMEMISEETAVVLLDQILPDMAGTTLLEELRRRGFEGRAAVITGMESELAMGDSGFDDSVTKPVSRAELLNVVDSLLRWDERDAVLQSSYEVMNRLAEIEEQSDGEKPPDSSEYERLKRRLTALESDSGHAQPIELTAEGLPIEEVRDSLTE